MYCTSRTILAISAIAIASMAYAETPTGNPDSFKLDRKEKLKNNDPVPVRPRMPGMNRWVTAQICNGVLTVEFPSDAEMGTVTIGTGDFTVFAASIDSSDPSVQLPPLSGSFILSIAFDNGDEYEGEIEI